MQMVGHDYPAVEGYAKSVPHDSFPGRCGDSTDFVQVHSALVDLTKEVFTIPRGDRDKVCPIPPVVITRQSHRTSAAVRMVCSVSWVHPCDDLD